MPDRDISDHNQTLLHVMPGDAGKRLDRYLTDSGLSLSRTRIQRLILQGMVRVQGCEKITPRLKVRAGQEIYVTIPEPEPLELEPEEIPFKVVHEDHHIIIIDKPAGLVVHPGAGNISHTLVHGLLGHCDDLSGIGGKLRPGIVHRLDKDTSGLMVVAKNDAAHKNLASQFRHGEVKKTYLALARGIPDDRSGVINLEIGRNPVHRKKMATLPKGLGRTALTTYEVVEEFAGASLLKVRIHTGRTHQIRVHMAAIGHPLLGDSLYGGPGHIVCRGQRLKITRQMLHSFQLSLKHPVSGKEMCFRAEIPRDMADIIKEMRGRQVQDIY